MMLRVLSGIILFICVASHSFASLTTAESNPTTPAEGLEAEGNQAWQQAISIYLSHLASNPTIVSLPRYKFWDIQVPRIHSPTRQACLRRPGRPASAH